MISTWSYIIDGKKCFAQLQAIRTYNNKALHEQNLFKKFFLTLWGFMQTMQHQNRILDTSF